MANDIDSQNKRKERLLSKRTRETRSRLIFTLTTRFCALNVPWTDNSLIQGSHQNNFALTGRGQRTDWLQVDGLFDQSKFCLPPSYLCPQKELLWTSSGIQSPDHSSRTSPCCNTRPRRFFSVFWSLSAFSHPYSTPLEIFHFNARLTVRLRSIVPQDRECCSLNFRPMF